MDADSQGPAAAFDRLVRWSANARTATRDKGPCAAPHAVDGDDAVRSAAIAGTTSPGLATATAPGVDEMPAMMQALNIDPVEVAIADRAMFSDMQSACAGCAAKARCRADLALATAAIHFSDYCENTSALNAMRAEPEFLRD